MNREKWSTVVWMGIGVVICIASFRLELGNFRAPGAGFFPFIAGSFLAVLSLIYLFQLGRAASPDTPRKPIWSDRSRGLKMIYTFVALTSYSVGMEYLGFVVSTILFIGFLLKVVQPQRWLVVIAGSVLASGVAYGIFELLLECQLPRGPWRIF